MFVKIRLENGSTSGPEKSMFGFPQTRKDGGWGSYRLDKSTPLLSFSISMWHWIIKVIPKMTARSVPQSLTPVIEELELRKSKQVVW